LSPQDEPVAPKGAAEPEQAAELIETIEAVEAEGTASQEPQDPIVEAFDDVCRRLAGFDDNLHTEWVDGYLTAVAASWRAVPLDEPSQTPPTRPGRTRPCSLDSASCVQNSIPKPCSTILSSCDWRR
jgi:hypothetical protein